MSKKKIKKQVTPTSAATSLPKNTFWTNFRLQAILIFVVSFLVYANTLTHQYTQDDAIVVYENMFTTDGVSGIPGILTKDTFFGFFKKEGKDKLVAGGRYRPLTLVMFAIEWQIFGDNPKIMHLFNVLWFGLTCVVLYWLLLQLFNKEKIPERAGLIAFCTALLFAVHPIHTEVVANIKGRDEIITLLGSLSALYFSIKAFRESNLGFNILAGVLFLLALFSKENAITFLAIVPMTYFVFTKAKAKKIILQTAYFAVPAMIFLLVRADVLFDMKALIGVGSEPTLELMNNPFVKIEGGRYVHFDAGERFATIIYTLGQYFKLLVFPNPLTHDYYPRHVDVMSFADWQVLLSLFGYLAATLGSIYFVLKEKSKVAFGVLFYLLSLSIVSNLAFPVGTNMAERLVFMPSVGFCLVVVLGIISLLSQKKAIDFHKKTILAVGIISVFFAGLTFARNFAWEDNYTLFTTDIKTSKNSAKLRNAVGGELLAKSTDQKNAAVKRKMQTEAVAHLQEAIKIHPNYKNAYLLLGNGCNYLERYEEAIQYYNKAIAIDPGYEEANNNLGITYREAGKYYGEKKGDLPNALKYLNQAIKMRPKDSEVLRLLGVANGIAGNLAEAVNFFTQFTKVEPNNAKGFFNLGSAYYNAGDPENGKLNHDKALSIDPNVAEKMRK